MPHFFDKIALVTGASSELGIAICKELVDYGMYVLGCSRTIRKIEEMAKSGKKYAEYLTPWKCDVTVEADVLDMFEYIHKQYGCIDVLVNNAMININSSLLSGETEDWRRMLKVGFEGMYLVSREAIKSMERGISKAQIIQVGSFVGDKIPLVSQLPGCKPSTFFHFYDGLKSMNLSVAEALRQDLRNRKNSRRIRVTTISPGAVERDYLFRTLACVPVMEFVNNYKYLDPKDVAAAVDCILSAPSNVIVGDVILEPSSLTV